jgi:hypothetical protein
MRWKGCTLTGRDGLPGVPERPGLPDRLSACLSCLSGLVLVSCGQRAAGTSSPLSPCRVGMKSSVTTSLVNRSVRPCSSTQGARLAGRIARTARTYLARSQEPGARSQEELDPLGGWMGGK